MCIIGTDTNTKESRKEHIPTYKTDWAHVFSLPDEWVTKALHESFTSRTKENFSVPIFNDLYERVIDLKPSLFTQNLLGNTKERKEEKDNSDKDAVIFSEEFYYSCLRSFLEATKSKEWKSNDNNMSNNLSEDDIQQIIKDDRYR